MVNSIRRFRIKKGTNEWFQAFRTRQTVERNSGTFANPRQGKQRYWAHALSVWKRNDLVASCSKKRCGRMQWTHIKKKLSVIQRPEERNGQCLQFSSYKKGGCRGNSSTATAPLQISESEKSETITISPCHGGPRSMSSLLPPPGKVATCWGHSYSWMCLTSRATDPVWHVLLF